MFILNNILTPLEDAFSSSSLGRDRGQWFSYCLLAFIIPFTSSISSNVFRCINTLFGLKVNKRRFYTFMASNKLPWGKLWRTLWSMIPDPLSDGRLLVALDDFINPKTGRTYLRLFMRLRSCRQSQPVQISLGTECGSCRTFETR